MGWAPSIRAEGLVRLAYPNAELAPIHELDIADVAAVALLSDDLVGEAPTLSGPESVSFAEQIQMISEAVGRPVRIEELSGSQAAKHMSRYMPPTFAQTLVQLWAEADGVPATISDRVEAIAGHPARSFRQWATDHADDFR